jgi:hypothetical protein
MKKARIILSLAIIAITGISLKLRQKSETDLEPSAVDNQSQSTSATQICQSYSRTIHALVAQSVHLMILLLCSFLDLGAIPLFFH